MSGQMRAYGGWRERRGYGLGSLNGSQFTTILEHTNTSHADGATVWSQTPAPMLFFRSRCVSLTLGSATNILVTLAGKP